LLNKPVLLVNLQGLYLDHHTDVEVSSGDDDVSKIDALAAKLRVLADNEAEGEGISLAKPMLLARSDPTCQCKLILLIGSFQVLHLLVGRNRNIHRSSPNANHQSLQ
jgi:hypothetical protein